MAAAGTFAYYNAAPVSLNYVLDTIEIPIALLALIAFVVGSVFAMLLMIPFVFSTKSRIRAIRRTCREQEQELKSLRKLPLDDVVTTDR